MLSNSHSVKSFIVARKLGTTRKTYSREECLMSSGSDEEEFDLSEDARTTAVARCGSSAAAADIVEQGCEIVLLIEIQTYSYSILCLTAGAWRQEMKATLLTFQGRYQNAPVCASVLEHPGMPSDQMIVIRIPTVCWNLLTMRTKTKVILG